MTMKRWTTKKTRAGLVFACGRSEMVWNRTGDNLAFAGLRYSGKGFNFGEGSELWRIELRDREGYCTQLKSSAWKNFSSKAGRTLTLSWKKLAGGAVDVKVTVTQDADAPILRCRLEVINRGDIYTVWAINFPSLTDVVGPTRSHRQDVLITTDGFGSAIPDPIRQPKLTGWTNRGYPNGLQTLPLVALTNGNRGLYFGVHDPAGGLCRFQHLPDKENDRLPMGILIEPENAGRSQKRVSLNYDVVLGLFEGDWFDVAKIYRPWALRQKRVAQKVEERGDIPDWSRRMPLWVRLNFPEKPKVSQAEMDRLADVTLRFRQALGRECAAHVYSWHNHPFDILYPRYNARPGVKRFVKQLQDGGVRVMPYINARLFDMDLRDWKTDGARRFATKEAAPKVGGDVEKLFTEVYGSNTQMAVMCAATKYWQDKIAGIVGRLVDDLGVDGVYMDQVAAAWSEVCSDPTHGHPLRGGGWWIDGYAQMMKETWRRIRQTGRAKDILLTTECNADAYLDMFGNFLMLHSIRNHVVPMFSAIYGGYAPLFAREANPKERLPFRIITAQNILWGCQNGWFGLDEMELLMKPEFRNELKFLRNLGELYDRLLPYFDGGRMLRPPAIEGKIKRADVVWKFCINWPETVSTIWAARWQRGRNHALAVVNTHDRAQTVRVPLTAEEKFGDASKIWWATTGVAGKVRIKRGVVELDLPADAMVLIQ